MPGTEPPVRIIDWRLTTWEGARREQLRRWSKLPLEQLNLAIEEMQESADRLSQPAHSQQTRAQPAATGNISARS